MNKINAKLSKEVKADTVGYCGRLLVTTHADFNIVREAEARRELLFYDEQRKV